MSRVTNAVAAHRKKKRILKRAKGFYGDRKNHLRITKEAVMRAMASHTRDRKRKKSDFRRLWIIRIGIASRIYGLSYNHLICGLKRMGCQLNRKMMAELAIHSPKVFQILVERARTALSS